jgi:ribosomal protein S8
MILVKKSMRDALTLLILASISRSRNVFLPVTVSSRAILGLFYANGLVSSYSRLERKLTLYFKVRLRYSNQAPMLKNIAFINPIVRHNKQTTKLLALWQLRKRLYITSYPFPIKHIDAYPLLLCFINP